MRRYQGIQSLHSQCGSWPLANYLAVPNLDPKLEKSKITSPLTPVFIGFLAWCTGGTSHLQEPNSGQLWGWSLPHQRP